MTMRKLLILTFVTGACFAAMPRPDAHAAVLPAVTLKVGPPHDGAILYGPADMLCDLDKCHMFSVPGFPSNGTIDFQMPNLSRQERIDLRRCFNLCRVSVLGYVSDETGHPTPDQRNPSITITPVEVRLEEMQKGSK